MYRYQAIGKKLFLSLDKHFKYFMLVWLRYLAQSGEMDIIKCLLNGDLRKHK